MNVFLLIALGLVIQLCLLVVVVVHFRMAIANTLKEVDNLEDRTVQLSRRIGMLRRSIDILRKGKS